MLCVSWSVCSTDPHEPGAQGEVGLRWGNGGGEIKDMLEKLKRSALNRRMGKYRDLKSIEVEAKLKAEKHEAGAGDE